MTGNRPSEPTRKERREQARAERKAIEEAQAGAAARRKRLIQLGSVIAGVVVIVAVILIVTGGGKGAKKIVPGTKAANENVATVNSLIGGIQQTKNVLGSPKAPVTLQYFGDLECPICKDFTLGAFPSLVSKYVRAGKLKVEYRSLETATREPAVFQEQQTAALAAGKQNKMWDFLELFYHEQGDEGTGYVTPSYLEGLAKQVPGLDLGKWSTDRQDPALANDVVVDAQAANQDGFSGTPSFMIGKSEGQMQKLEYASLTDPSSFESAINKLLA